VDLDHVARANRDRRVGGELDTIETTRLCELGEQLASGDEQAQQRRCIVDGHLASTRLRTWG